MVSHLWESLGLHGKRVLILHHDDLGLLHAQNAAYEVLGFPTGSIMVPAGWGAQLAHRPHLDLGVHLTLTSEWRAPRLRPLTTSASLRDSSGHFWSTVEEAWLHIRTEEAEAELRAQIHAALAMGIDVTHVDTHMGAVLRPDLAEIYLKLALEFRLPAFIPESLEAINLPAPLRLPIESLLDRAPLPKVRWLDSYPVPPDQRRAWYLDTLSRAGPGVYHLIHHSALPTPEAQSLPDWEKRKADYEALQDAEVRRVIGEFTLLTYRQVREALRRVG
ncbi:hypothetical protein SE15_01080 [Thermanaerothrix daxensis]|uniref:Carbohydrate deacetylase n=1 Tax=Thermanaerothrix daxensis TaxID=869279 RepID=A0A0P6XWR1_9CHLR|nr:polysaccharide deacetylase family protein [Thermanaerothrix daxensis]KPL83862.1 hypothetical protein SE15_01080 [Thermanaerothrix daxensis]